MAEFQKYKGYPSDAEQNVQKPDHLPDPIIVNVQDGVPVLYPECQGVGVRVVHPVNPKAPSKNMGLVMFYIPPHVVLQPGSHSTEETYVVIEGSGEMTFHNSKSKIKKGDFIYLQPWCVHGIENNGTETLVVLICTSPPNP